MKTGASVSKKSLKLRCHWSEQIIVYKNMNGETVGDRGSNVNNIHKKDISQNGQKGKYKDMT